MCGLQLAVSGLILALALFLPAGHLDWWQVWAYLGIFVGVIAFNALFVLRGDRELIAERSETNENAEPWDTMVRAALLVATTFVVRTRLEDRTLRAELPGYGEFAGQVRYRLVPGLW